MRLCVSVRDTFFGSSRMGYGPAYSRTHALRILPQCAGSIAMLARLPGFFAFRKFLFRDIAGQSALNGVKVNNVSILQQCNRAARLGFRTHMAHAETPGRARESAIGD